MMLLGMGLAFFFGKPFIQPIAAGSAGDPLGGVVRAAAGAGSTSGECTLPDRHCRLHRPLVDVPRHTARLIIRVVGDSSDAARAMGIRPALVRTFVTAAGGAFAGIGGAYLSLFYPGSWNEGISSGQGLMAVAAGDFRPLEPHRLPLGSADLRRGRRAWPGAAIGGHFARLLPFLRRTLRAHARRAHRNILAQPRRNRRTGRAQHHQNRRPPMSGLGGLNKSPNGVVIGLVQLQLPVVKTPEDLAAQTARIVEMVGKAAAQYGHDGPRRLPRIRAARPLDDTNPEIMCSHGRAGGRCVQAGLHRQRYLGLLLADGVQSRMAMPYQFGHHHRPDQGELTPLLPKAPPLGPGRALGARRSRHSRDATGRTARSLP